MPTVAVTADPDTYASLQPRGQRILQAIDRMAMDTALESSAKFDRTRSVALVLGSGWVVEEIDISDIYLSRPSEQWMKNYISAYEESLMVYLTRTAGEENELVYYLDWFMSRRDVTVSTLYSGANPLAEAASLDAWGYRRAPWPWQLADPYAIAEYTGQAGFKIGPAPTPQLSPTSAPVRTQTPSESSEDGTELNGPPIFTPVRLTLAPGDMASISVTLPPTTFSGGFALTVTLPAGIDLTGLPQCDPSGSCETAALQTETQQNQGGSTTIKISGLMGDSPLSFSMTIEAVAEDNLETPLIATAELGFMSRSAHTGEPLVSELEIVIEDARAYMAPHALWNA